MEIKTGGERGMSRELFLFTLVELLVVVTIIMVLAALLLPALFNAKRRAETLTCVANMKQVGLAFHMYAGDFNGSLVPFNTEPSGATCLYHFWPHTLVNFGYLATPKWGLYSGEQNSWARSGPLYCPAVNRHLTRSGGGSYGVNLSHVGFGYNGRAPKLGRVRRVGDLLLLGETRDRAYYSADPQGDNVRHTYMYCPLCTDWSGTAYQASPRHRPNISNVCYMDGHVASNPYLDVKANKGDLFGHLNPN